MELLEKEKSMGGLPSRLRGSQTDETEERELTRHMTNRIVIILLLNRIG